jgi:hypothetical protein
MSFVQKCDVHCVLTQPAFQISETLQNSTRFILNLVRDSVTFYRGISMFEIKLEIRALTASHNFIQIVQYVLTMLFHRRQFKTEQWDEEDELIYIRQGEPLSSINKVRFPPMSLQRRAQNPMNNAIFFIPLILVIW